MGDQLFVYQGFRPWRPTPDARLVKTFDIYDVPTAGVIESQGVKYLFLCAEGLGGPGSVWTYTLATDSEIDDLESAPAKDLPGLAFRFMADHPSTVAIALDEYGIVASTLQEAMPDDRRPPASIAVETAVEFVHSLEVQLERLRRLHSASA